MPLRQTIDGYINGQFLFGQPVAPFPAYRNHYIYPRPFSCTAARGSPLKDVSHLTTSRISGPNVHNSSRSKQFTRKRKHSSDLESFDNSDPSNALSTPVALPSSKLRVDGRSNKIPRLDPETPIASVEYDSIENQPVPKSGATKPANYAVETMSPQDYNSARKDRLEEVDKFKRLGHREEDVELFRKISLRSFDPLLPSNWELDFDVLPDSIYAETPKEPFINSLELSAKKAGDLRARKMLRSLIALGAHVRDDAMLGIEPHKKVAKTFKKCLDWSLSDADLDRKCGVLPIVTIHSASRWVDDKDIQAALNKKLKKLAQAWEKALGPDNLDRMPPLYGIAVSHGVWAILSYNSDGESQASNARNNPENVSSLIASFSFMKDGQEVWVACAFAIFATHCRDMLLKTLNSGYVGAFDGSSKVQLPFDEDE